jgi:hypothetical protein
MACATPLAGGYRRSATYIDKNLKGGDPAGLPVEQPTEGRLAAHNALEGDRMTTDERIVVAAHDHHEICEVPDRP